MCPAWFLARGLFPVCPRRHRGESSHPLMHTVTNSVPQVSDCRWEDRPPTPVLDALLPQAFVRMGPMADLQSGKRLCSPRNKSDLPLLRKGAEGNRRGPGRDQTNVCVCAHILTGYNHTLFQDNFLFATANCHSKENRSGSVISGCCCRTPAACGVSGLSAAAS